MLQKTLLNSLKPKLNSIRSDFFVTSVVIIILIAFVYNDIITGRYFVERSLRLKMGGLMICVGYACIKCWSKANRNNIILCIAMLMTALGDYMLTMNVYYSLGIICFAIVHTLYIIRHWYYLSLMQKRYTCVMAIILFVIVVILIFIIQPILIKIALGYGLILFVSLFTASMLLYITDNRKKRICIFWGILLFFLCDMCVAIFNVVNGVVGNVAAVFIWIWYLPAQLFLVLSGDRYDHHKGAN